MRARDEETGEAPPLPIHPVTAEKLAIEKMQRECWCGGREQCEHEQEEDVAEMLKWNAVKDCDEVISVRRREVAVEKKEAWWKREEERKRRLRMKAWEAAELERTGRMEDDNVYGMKAPWRSRGRGRPLTGVPERSPERLFCSTPCRRAVVGEPLTSTPTQSPER